MEKISHLLLIVLFFIFYPTLGEAVEWEPIFQELKIFSQRNPVIFSEHEWEQVEKLLAPTDKKNEVWEMFLKEFPGKLFWNSKIIFPFEDKDLAKKLWPYQLKGKLSTQRMILANVLYDLYKKDENELKLPLLKQAAELGHAKAAYALFEDVYNEEPESRKDWLHKAAAQGFDEALYKLAMNYLFFPEDLNLKEDKEFARALCKSAAAQGHQEAEFYLKVAPYSEGAWGVQQNFQKALEEAQKLSKTNNLLAKEYINSFLLQDEICLKENEGLTDSDIESLNKLTLFTVEELSSPMQETKEFNITLYEASGSIIGNFTNEAREGESSANEEEFISLSDEELPAKVSWKRLRKTSDKEEELYPEDLGISSTNKVGEAEHKPSTSRKSIIVKEDSDDDDIALLIKKPYSEKFNNFPQGVIVISTQLKLLANVYLRNIDETANIFLPRYTLEIESPEGSLEKRSDFFRTPQKKEICVFASGGLQNSWEKNVGHVNKIFFKNKAKIIRASWIQKHLSQEKKITRDLEEEFAGRENELHSEFYYDIFFKHFFLPILSGLVDEKYVVKRLTINGFSWWDVCDSCEGRLTKHLSLLPRGCELTYQVASMRRYRHRYPKNSVLEEASVPATEEMKAWDKIWSQVLRHARLKFDDETTKESFWTSTKDGLELCKWFGQAFVENKMASNERKASPSKRGDILKYYQDVTDQENQELQTLLSYLKDKNWELSCWYRPPHYPDSVQRKWKKHWRQLVIPHFGWESVKDTRLTGESGGECQMCGYSGLYNIHWIFHPKYRVSESFLKRPKNEQSMQEWVAGFTAETPFNELPEVLQQKRKQSLGVGSECIKILSLSWEDSEDWRQDYPDDMRESKWEELDQREADNEALDKAERELRKKGKRKKSNSSFSEDSNDNEGYETDGLF